MSNYRSFFGFKREPFAEDLDADHLLKLPAMIAAKERMDYALSIGGVMALSGEVGSGKSTSIRWALSQYHPSQVKMVRVVGNGGPITEFYKNLCIEMGIDLQTNSRSKLIRAFQDAVIDAAKNKRQKVMVVVDEAGLLRADVFTEMHVLTQFEQDSKHHFALILAGQRNVIDKICYRGSTPLASRVIARQHLSAVSRDQMEEYIEHHVKCAGNKNRVFEPDAITAVQQGSGGGLRKANGLARGALIVAAAEKRELVNSEHVRIASSELID